MMSNQQSKVKTILSGIVLGFLLLIATYLIVCSFSAKQYATSKSIEIDAPAAVVYKQVADFKKWKDWDPWFDLDTNQVRDYKGNAYEEGATYSWTGSDEVGEGQMTCTSLTLNKALGFRVDFKKPFESTANGDFILEEKNAKTMVTWSFHGEVPFFMRALKFVMINMLQKDFTKGLGKLKILSEHSNELDGQTIGQNYVVKEEHLEATQYLVYRSTEKIDSLDAFFMEEMPKIGMLVETNKMEMNGYPSTFYHEWRPEENKVDLSLAIPIKKAEKVMKPYEVFNLPSTDALVIDYYGPYDKMEGAYDALAKELSQTKNYQQNGDYMEVYVGDPAALNYDFSKVLTKIYLPFKRINP